MSSKIDMAILSYKKACMRFIKEYTEYNSKNVSKIKNGVFTVCFDDTFELAGSIIDIIHWAVVLFETLDDDIKMTNGEKSLYQK